MTDKLLKLLSDLPGHFVSNEHVFRETSMSNISDMMVTKHQMSMFVHAARLSSDDPVHKIISCPDPSEWRRNPGMTDSASRDWGRWMVTAEGLAPTECILGSSQE